MSHSSKVKFAVVTGCGKGGIGCALVKQFVAYGYTVIATLLSHESRDHLIHDRIHVLNLDVTKKEEMLPFKNVVGRLTNGRLDILVNNAGICTDEIPHPKLLLAYV
ncbi:hypothetical protein F4808DRAFT_425299 [Astrocystis sublimbata]|nr:hypothetical protein F4808DRAFT_425299 [Astrocystis sublimbata]